MSESDVEWEMDPLVAVTVNVVVPGGDFGPELLEHDGIRRTLAAIKPSNRKPSSLRLRDVRRLRFAAPATKTTPTTPAPHNIEEGRCLGVS